MALSEDPIPISLVAHTVFCPRRAWLEAVERTGHGTAETSIVTGQDLVEEARAELYHAQAEQIRKENT